MFLVPTQHRFSVAEYHERFAGDETVELIDGVVYDKMVTNPRRRRAVNQLMRRLIRDGFTVGIGPITLDSSEPEPDLTVLKGEDPEGRHPEPNDIRLVIEVSDTSLQHDREIKRPMYQAAGVVVWIVNLQDGCFEINGQPCPSAQIDDTTIDFKSLL